MSKADSSDDDGSIISKGTSGAVVEAVERFLAIVRSHGLTVFAVIDHSGEARARGLTLRDTEVVIFGSPEAGTPVMESAPLAALDLPLKVLIWDDGGTTTVSFTAPTEVATRYSLTQELGARLAGIDHLTNELVGG